VADKVVPMLSWATRKKDVWWSGDIAARILNLSTTWRWAVGFTPCKKPLILTGLKSRSVPELVWTLRRKIPFPCLEWNLDSSVVQFVVYSLYRLSYPVAIIFKRLFVYHLNRSRDIVVGIATVYGLDDRMVGVLVPVGVKNFHFSMSSLPALGSTEAPIQWVPGALSPGDKAAGAWIWPFTSS
jgi:hypothetical protein